MSSFRASNVVRIDPRTAGTFSDVIEAGSMEGLITPPSDMLISDRSDKLLCGL